MVLEPVVIRAAHGSAPLRVPTVRAQVRRHHNDARAARAARAAARARRVACGGQLVAFSAAGAAPGEPAAVVEGLRDGRGVDAGADVALRGGIGVLVIDVVREERMRKITDLPGEHGVS